MNLPEAAEQFTAVWADPLAAARLARRLSYREVDTLAGVLVAMGEPEIAEQWQRAQLQSAKM